jgi:hypothetical protein
MGLQVMKPSLINITEHHKKQDHVKMYRNYLDMFSKFMRSPDYPQAGFIADVNKLPVDKETLKTAIKVLLSATKDEQLKEDLRATYISLSNFQQGVGSRDIGFNAMLYSYKLGIASESEKLALIRQMPIDMEADKKWSEKTHSERNQLSTEVNSL